MKKLREKMISNIQNSQGYTLVELLVSFVILSILMTSALMVITSATKVYTHIKDVNTALNVSTILMDKIEGELDQSTITHVTDGTSIGYMKESAPNAVMSVTRKEAEGGTGDESNPNVLQIVYATDTEKPWYYSNNTYMGNEIKSLTFQTKKAASEEEHNTVVVTLTVGNRRTDFSYTRTKTIRCRAIR